MKDWLHERDTKGAYTNILQELGLNDHENFRKYLRMNTDMLYYVVFFPVAFVETNILFAFHDNKIVNPPCFFSSTLSLFLCL